MYGTVRHLSGCLSVSTGNAHDCSCERKIRALGGYTNAILLAVVAVGIVVAAYHRFYNPREVFGEMVIIPAILGGALNWWQHYELEHGHERELIRYWHVLAIGSFTFLMQFSVGMWSGSLSLTSDAWHVLVDNGAAIVSLAVVCLVPERTDKAHLTHGLMSAHVLSDLFQNVAVIATGAWIVYTGEYVVDSITSVAIAVLLFAWAIHFAFRSYRH